MNSRFKRGSGRYTCQSCKRQTRETGGSESGSRLCYRCYEIGGLENIILDCGAASTEGQEAQKEIDALKQGGTK